MNIWRKMNSLYMKSCYFFINISYLFLSQKRRVSNWMMISHFLLIGSLPTQRYGLPNIDFPFFKHVSDEDVRNMYPFKKISNILNLNDDQKMFSDLIFFYFLEMNFRWKNVCRILESKFSKSGIFLEKKCSANFLIFRS